MADIVMAYRDYGLDSLDGYGLYYGLYRHGLYSMAYTVMVDTVMVGIVMVDTVLA